MRRGRLVPRAPVAVGCLALAVTVAACGGNPTPAASSSTSTTLRVPPFRAAPQITSQTVTVNGQSVNVPTERPGVPISSGTDTGGQIIITSAGVLPLHLFVNLSQLITWTNLTDKAVSVRFLYSSVHSGNIPPGGTFTYKSPTLYTFNYVTSTGYRGEVAIGAFNE